VLRSVPRGYKNDEEDRLRQLSYGTPARQDMSLGAEEVNWGIEASEVVSAVQLRLEGQPVKRRLSAIVSQYLERVIQSHCYSSCVKIRCQETDSGDCDSLRTLLSVTVNYKVWKK
jgi:hypothetical protein